VTIAAGAGASAVVLADGRVLVWGEGDGSPREWLPKGTAPMQLLLRVGIRCALGQGHDIDCAFSEPWHTTQALALAAGMPGAPEDDPSLGNNLSFAYVPPICVLDLQHAVMCAWPDDPNLTMLGADGEHLAVGADHVCFSRAGQGLKCVGHSLIPGDLAVERWSQPLDTVGTNIRDVVSNGENVCALTNDGDLWCWGHNLHGEVGTANQNELRPVLVQGLSGKVVSVSMGGQHTCAVTTDGGAWCWGDSDFGALGWTPHDSAPRPHPPARVAGLEQGGVAVAAGRDHTCVIDNNGEVWCWGRSDAGQLGDGAETSSPSGYPGFRSSPAPVVACD
jgi:Regulator of chromosome condensation (RCC1) repeat